MIEATSVSEALPVGSDCFKAHVYSQRSLQLCTMKPGVTGSASEGEPPHVGSCIRVDISTYENS